MTDDPTIPIPGDATGPDAEATGRGAADATGTTGWGTGDPAPGATDATGLGAGDPDAARSGGPDGPAAGEATAASGAAGDRRRTGSDGRRRRLIIGGVAGTVVLVLLVCGGLVALAAGVGRIIRHSDDVERARSRTATACRDLERRLNRLTPPGATSGPRQRATAIRNENVAVRPFLAELEQMPGWRDDRDDTEDRRERHAELWRRLVDARAAYADALDRQASGGEPAFFVVPEDRRGRPVTDRLERWPASCAAAARRLAAPDL
ncbi:hypothetical protein [Micromonospora sp. HM5-17]|uniref:hypothetical protein n=1 Tax=Micromonospora sp. HM5-17 TaxID=2487710 RepID=UPI000F48BF43|nr:hypothetical protein [Micromonospora sp. HM5-17]ROT32176.1 hypothetical protein EF879_11250 [Micromonospora sp. HM5-17]